MQKKKNAAHFLKWNLSIPNLSDMCYQSQQIVGSLASKSCWKLHDSENERSHDGDRGNPWHPTTKSASQLQKKQQNAPCIDIPMHGNTLGFIPAHCYQYINISLVYPLTKDCSHKWKFTKGFPY